jgi:anti-sigma28 factor (negative regulator of flagellin synthesis)
MTHSGHQGNQAQSHPVDAAAANAEDNGNTDAPALPETNPMTKSIINTEVSQEVHRPPVRETPPELIQKVKAALMPVRDDLVDDVRRRIKSGAYEVKSDVLATDILQHLQDLREQNKDASG